MPVLSSSPSTVGGVTKAPGSWSAKGFCCGFSLRNFWYSSDLTAAGITGRRNDPATAQLW